MNTMNKKRILLVEDDAAFGLMLQGWLSKQAFEPVLCTTLGEAKRNYESAVFDLVLTDLRLPDGGVLHLLDWLQQQARMAPVLVIPIYGHVQIAFQAT